MKKTLLIFLFAVIFYGCSSSVNTANMSADEYFQYALSLFKDEDYIQAIQEFQSILLQYPGNAIADDAQYYLAESHFQKGEYILAAYEYSRLIKDIPASEYVPKAQFMLAQSYYELSPKFPLDQKYTRKAIEEFQAFIDFFPADERVADAEKKINELNTKLAEKEYNNAVIYEKLGYNDAALFYFNLVADTYHDTKYGPEAMFKKIKLLADKKDNKETLKAISSFLQKYPSDPKVTEVKKLQESLNGHI